MHLVAKEEALAYHLREGRDTARDAEPATTRRDGAPRGDHSGRPGTSPVFGCKHVRVLNWTHAEMLAYYSRLLEEYGGSNWVRYLLKDSLACTLISFMLSIIKTLACVAGSALYALGKYGVVEPVPFWLMAPTASQSNSAQIFEEYYKKKLDLKKKEKAQSAKLRASGVVPGPASQEASQLRAAKVARSRG